MELKDKIFTFIVTVHSHIWLCTIAESKKKIIFILHTFKIIFVSVFFYSSILSLPHACLLSLQLHCHQLVQGCSIADSPPVPQDFGSQPYLLLVGGRRQRVLTLSSSVVCLLATCPDTKKFFCFFQLRNRVFQW